MQNLIWRKRKQTLLATDSNSLLIESFTTFWNDGKGAKEITSANFISTLLQIMTVSSLGG